MTCCAMVQGMRSPEARLPRDRPHITEPFEISPPRHTCSPTRGSDIRDSAIGGRAGGGRGREGGREGEEIERVIESREGGGGRGGEREGMGGRKGGREVEGEGGKGKGGTDISKTEIQPFSHSDWWEDCLGLELL